MCSSCDVAAAFAYGCHPPDLLPRHSTSTRRTAASALVIHSRRNRAAVCGTQGGCSGAQTRSSSVRRH